MKANEAPGFPEKVYIPRDPEYPQSPNIWWERESSESNIEYTRTDAFIEKACEWMRNYVNPTAGTYLFDEDIKKFIDYMKGE